MLQIHVGLSLIGIVAGLIVLYQLLTGAFSRSLTLLFLATTILTDVTGFPLKPFGFDPPRAVGILSLLLLLGAVVALYIFKLAGPWRWIYVAAAVASLYLNVFVGVVQSFQKLPFLHALAPTQSEPPFVVTQVIVLVAFLALGVVAALRFRPGPEFAA